MTKPYYDDGTVTLYHGRLEDLLPELGIRPNLVVADPPYAETSLAWDRWPAGWPGVVAAYASSMWCFGSMRMFLERRDEFAAWRMSHDIVWEGAAAIRWLASRAPAAVLPAREEATA